MAKPPMVVAATLMVLGVGCSRGSGDAAGRDGPEAEAPAWNLGTGVGERFGPFPNADGWVAVVLLRHDPIESFLETVEDAAAQGFETRSATGGPCQQRWGRDEVPFGSNGEGDGFGFGGDAPFGADLPVGARVEAVSCSATAERHGERVSISVVASLGEGTSAFPPRPAVVLATTTAPLPDVEFRRQAIDLQLPAITEASPTDSELAAAGLAAREPLAPVGVVWLPQLGSEGCWGALLRSAAPSPDAVGEAISQLTFSRFFEGGGEASVIGDRHAFTQTAIVPADGPHVLVAAVETPAGSDVLICSDSR